MLPATAVAALCIGVSAGWWLGSRESHQTRDQRQPADAPIAEPERQPVDEPIAQTITPVNVDAGATAMDTAAMAALQKNAEDALARANSAAADAARIAAEREATLTATLEAARSEHAEAMATIRAEAADAKARQAVDQRVREIIESALLSSSSSDALRHGTTVVEALHAARAALAANADNASPTVRFELHMSLGALLMGNGAAKEAAPLFVEAVDIARGVHPGSVKLARAAEQAAEALCASGRPADALPLATEADRKSVV